MFNVRKVSSQVVEIHSSGSLTHQKWLEYQQLILSLLSKSKKKLYILSNFLNIQSFVSQFTEVDGVEYLAHSQLGLNVIVCRCSVMAFHLKLSEKHALKEGKPVLFKACHNYETAIEILKQQRDLENNADICYVDTTLKPERLPA